MNNKIIGGISTLIILALVYIAFDSEVTTASEGNADVYAVESVTNSPAKDKIVDFTFKKDGKEHSFAEFAKGKAVFLNFWGTWCGPCRREIPDIIKIRKELSDKEILIVGVALERPNVSDKVGVVKSFYKKNDLNYINFVDDKHQLAKAYGGMRAVPTTLIIDKNGNIEEKIIGMRDYNAFMNSIKKVL